MDAKKVTVGGRDYYLLYNGAAYFALKDIEQLFTAMSDDLDVFCRVVSVLSQQGELKRRYDGYEPGAVIDAGELPVSATAAEMMAVRGAALEAVLSGMGREIEDEKKERDLSLEKFKKKPERKTS